MAIATKPKPKPPAKKRRAQHHRQSRHYLKTYLPYLPLLAIIGLGAGVNQLWATGVISAQGTESLTAMRIDALSSSQTPWGLIVLAVTFAAFALLVFKYWYRVHRTINR